MFVIGDSVNITIPIQTGIFTVEVGIFTLLAAYYVSNVEYPHEYAMVLVVLQCLVLEEPYIRITSKTYAFPVGKLRKAMEDTPDTSQDTLSSYKFLEQTLPGDHELEALVLATQGSAPETERQGGGRD